LKKRLRRDSPAVLFGCGNKALLNGGGLAVIGSRNATKQDLAYSRGLGELAASNGYSIVSGGARGVDEASMLGALEGVKAGGLTRVVEGGGAMQFFLVFEVNTAERYEPPPFRLVKDELKNRLREAREKKYLDEWLTKIKKEAYIRIML